MKFFDNCRFNKITQKSLFCLIMILFSTGFTGCYHRHNNGLFASLKDDNEDVVDLNDNDIGFRIHKENHKGKVFEIFLSLISEDCAESKDFVSISVIYKGLTPECDNHKINLELSSDTGVKVNLEREALSAEDKKTLNESRSSFKGMFTESIWFLISRKDFNKLINSETVSFKLSIPSDNISGNFSQNEMSTVKRLSPKLFKRKPFKGQTIDETKKEMKDLEKAFEEAFIDFKVLSYHAKKADIAKHYNVQLNSEDKNPQTNHKEEVVFPKIKGKKAGALVLGFNDADQLVYIKDMAGSNKVDWLKPEKKK